MAVAVGAGETGMRFIGRRKRWSRERGDYYTDAYRGLLADAEDFYNTYRQSDLADEVSFDQSKGVATVELTLQDDVPGGGGQATIPLNEYWEVMPMEVYKPLRSHETFTLAADQTKLEAVRMAWEMSRPHTPAAGAATTYQNLLHRFVEEYVRSQFVLTQTIEVGRRSQLSASWEGVDRAQKINVAPGPEPPRAIIGAIDDHPDYDADKKQFLKKAPMIRQIDRGKYSIQASWWFARRWSATLYEGDVEAANP